MKTRGLLLLMGMVIVTVLGIAVLVTPLETDAHLNTDHQSAAPARTPARPLAYDVAHLVTPERLYLGVALSGAPQDMSLIEDFANMVDKKPNLITIYESFRDSFAAAEVRKIYQYGALAIVRWEPFTAPLADIAAGEHDKYVTEFAEAVRTLNLPIALTFAHEMNGSWYPWGADSIRPEDFVAAWRHIHGIFAEVGATNVIWTWTPNVINPVPHIPLEPLYPGDEYVDWVGIDGYYTHRGQQTFADLFVPTIAHVQNFTDKPVLIVETGSEPGSMRPLAIADLFTSVAEMPEVIGFSYFNQLGSGNWVIDDDPAAVDTFREHAADPRFSFTVL